MVGKDFIGSYSSIFLLCETCLTKVKKEEEVFARKEEKEIFAAEIDVLIEVISGGVFSLDDGFLIFYPSNFKAGFGIVFFQLIQVKSETRPFVNLKDSCFWNHAFVRKRIKDSKFRHVNLLSVLTPKKESLKAAPFPL